MLRGAHETADQGHYGPGPGHSRGHLVESLADGIAIMTIDSEKCESFCVTDLGYLDSAGDISSIAVEIHNGRKFVNPGWEECGFELKHHCSSVTDWHDDHGIATEHYAEISSLAQELTGCTHALVSSHINRNPEQSRVHADLGPIMLAHSDFTESYGDLICARYLNDSEESRLALARAGITKTEVGNAKRLLIMQFWRNVGPARMDMPLALCDARTVPRQDLHAIAVHNYAGSGFSFDAYGLKAPTGAAHDWYAYPQMTVDEVLVFRTYDSERIARGQCFWTPHCAFRDPGVREGNPARYSIELRATCLF